MNGSISFLQSALLSFYQTDARHLPWRKNKDPYRIWISEMMLQQTQVKTVIPYFERWMNRYPTLSELAYASLDDLLKYWEGLGYYTRVKNIHKAVSILHNDYHDAFPDEYERVLALPGIGPYSAGAILSIAFDQRKAAVDGNVHRVLSRYLGQPFTKLDLEKKMDEYLPYENIGNFNQALMEVGARICFANSEPECNACPLVSHCIAYQQQWTDQLPLKSKPIKKTIEHKTVLVITDHCTYWITKRPEEGLLGGLWEFPMVAGFLSVQGVNTWLRNHHLIADTVEPLELIHHGFSHKTWIVQPYQITVTPPLNAMTPFVSATKEELVQTYALSALITTVLENLT